MWQIRLNEFYWRILGWFECFNIVNVNALLIRERGGGEVIPQTYILTYAMVAVDRLTVGVRINVKK